MQQQYGEWTGVMNIPRHSYQCSYCNSQTGVNVGYYCIDGQNQQRGFIYLCGHCNQPTYFSNDTQVPAPVLGNEISHLPNDLMALYEEARRCTSLGAYTACVLACRKILMHIAVDRGANPGESFYKYVEWLDSNHYTPPGSKVWVDHIRQKGNEANHEIVIMSQDEARRLLVFVEMLLKFIYEFHSLITPPTPLNNTSGHGRANPHNYIQPTILPTGCCSPLLLPASRQCEGKI